MSRHSKWANIKRKKDVTDKKRSTTFTKLANAITIAARQGQPDPTMNFKLRVAVDKARAVNMPKDNIERAIAKAKASEDGAALEQLQFEVIGPGGVGAIVTATTDNRNRVLNSIKGVLNKYESALAGPNAIAWQFVLRGHLMVPLPPTPAAREELELAAIDAGSLEVEEHEGFLIISTEPHDLEKIKNALEQCAITIEEVGMGLIPTNTVPITDAVMEKKIDALINELEEIDEVDEVITNAEFNN